MSHEPPIVPIPVLSYHSEDQSASLRLLTMLVLLAGAANAGLSTISFGANALEDWPALSRSADAALAIGQITAWTVVAFSCLLFIATCRGWVVVVAAQGVALALDVLYYVRQISDDPRFLSLAVFVADMLSDWLLPLLLIVVLIRHDMRPRRKNDSPSRR